MMAGNSMTQGRDRSAAGRFTSQHGYGDVDRQTSPESCVGLQDTIGGIELVLAYKRRTYDMLGIQEGSRILDVGCGTGDDVRAMVEIVGSSGHVVGVDKSETMIDTAIERSQGSDLPVEFRVGDAYELEFDDAYFDGCRADRVFHHLKDRERALGELMRVTRPGGRIVAFDPDFDGTIIDAPSRDLTRRTVLQVSDWYSQGQCGRQLRRLFKQAGLTDLVVIPETFLFTEYQLADQLIGFEDAARAVGDESEGTSADVSSWLARLREYNEKGLFLAMILGFTVSACRP